MIIELTCKLGLLKQKQQRVAVEPERGGDIGVADILQ